MTTESELRPGGQPSGSSTRRVENPSRERVESHCGSCGAASVQVEQLGALARNLDLSDRRYSIERIEDPDDLEQVLDACHRVVATLRDRWPNQSLEVIANYTGGTKTMSLGLGLFALRATENPWLLQLNRVVAGGRTDLVGVRAGDQSVLQVGSAFIAEVLLGHAEELAARSHFQAAVDLLATPLPRGPLRPNEQQLLLRGQLRYRLLEARDRLDFRLARELAKQDPELEATYGPWLEKLVLIGSVLAGEGPPPGPAFTGQELVDELRDNASRQLALGHPEAALQRLRNAAEVLALARLRRGEATGTEPSRPPDLISAIELLAQRGDALGKFGWRTRDELRHLVKIECGPLTRMGLAPLAEDVWRPSIRRWNVWLDEAQELL